MSLPFGVGLFFCAFLKNRVVPYLFREFRKRKI
nr:MAG TPA: hypothetical protein [Caudoviricetes sp.]